MTFPFLISARLSGNEPDNEDYEEFEDMMEDISNNPNEQPLSIRLRRYVQTLVQKVGFFGILACASVSIFGCNFCFKDLL